MNFNQLKKNINSLFASSKIFENFPDMIIYIGSDGVVKEANKAAVNFFGPLENITINEFLTDGMKSIKDSIKHKKSVLVHSKSKDNDYLELSASKIGDDCCISLRDNTLQINENKKKDGIEKFNNDKNAMLVHLENDIKSPLNSIIGFSQGLVDGIGGEITQKQDKYLKIILNNANDMRDFTDKFLDFTYAESLLYEPEIKKFDVISAVKDVLKDHEALMFQKNIEPEFDYSTIDVRYITADYKAFKKAFENILEVSISLTQNGKIFLRLSYPDEESGITYGLEEDKRYIQLSIKDTGLNLTPEEMEYICNPYAKTDKGRKVFVRSLRLGIASILIKRSEGFFAINSESGQGNFYNLIIPEIREENE